MVRVSQSWLLFPLGRKEVGMTSPDLATLPVDTSTRSSHAAGSRRPTFGSTMRRPIILGIGGTVRPNSSSERALRISLHAAEAAGAEIIVLAGRDLMVPLYDPSTVERSVEAERLVAAFRACDGLIVASPAYHGTVSGLVKNALDYAEDLREGARTYFDGVAFGCIACGAGWQAPAQTLSCLRIIAHSLRAWPTPFGAAVNASQHAIGAAECVQTDDPVASQLSLVGQQVVDFACGRAIGAAT